MVFKWGWFVTWLHVCCLVQIQILQTLVGHLNSKNQLTKDLLNNLHVKQDQSYMETQCIIYNGPNLKEHSE